MPLTVPNGKPRHIDNCYAYAAQREVVQGLWPYFHAPARGREGTR